jgi:dienelactone hydrolase
VALALVALIGLVAACGEEDDAATTDVSDPTEDDTSSATPDEEPVASPPFEIETFEQTFVDDTRETPAIAGTGVDASDDRTLVSSVRIPQAEGRFPLVVFSHGVDGHPDKFVRLLDAWAAAGYVVVAPAFPLSNGDVPGEASVFDLQEQSGDVSFLIDEVLAASHVPGDPFEGVVDNERIGIGGLSLGAATTYTTAFGECCQDDRIDAVVTLSGLAVPVAPDHLDLPVFVGHSDDDPLLAYESAVEMYEGFTGPAYLLTVFGGSHALAYEDNGHPAGPVIDLATTRFWDRYLRGDPDVPQELLTTEELADRATLQQGGSLS